MEMSNKTNHRKEKFKDICLDYLADNKIKLVKYYSLQIKKFQYFIVFFLTAIIRRTTGKLKINIVGGSIPVFFNLL